MKKSILRSIKRALVGAPIESSQMHHQRLSNSQALATFSSDPLSSVAYASEEILMVLVLAGSSFLYLSIPISLAIIALLIIVVISYRQTIHAYPSGGGAYTVAKDNLGEMPSFIVAGALLTDYVLTVAVSVSAGIAALTSAFPSLHGQNIPLALLAIFVLSVMNLRGIRESSTIFAIPTYAFVFGVFTMLIFGIIKFFNGTFTHIPYTDLPIQSELTLFLFLRAFSSGCTAMTGVEAVSNGVPVFKAPEAKNASNTLLVMVGILAIMFFGITFLSHYHGIMPQEHETVISQLARSIFGTNYFYYFIQFATMGILILAANTSYADFPRLSSILAQDYLLPRQFKRLGDRLVFSNGIIMLGVFSGLLVVLFDASTHALIPLYAVGVFLSFTFSQFGMVKYWYKGQKPGWKNHLFINALGGFLTAMVTIIFVVTKFIYGAWIIFLLIPILIYIFSKIRGHYLDVGKQLSIIEEDPKIYLKPATDHTVILPISGMHKGTIEALRYAHSIGKDVRVVYVELDPNTTERFKELWEIWNRGASLVVLKSPYRSVLGPVLKYFDEVKETEPKENITILVPEFVTSRLWQNILHNQTALLLRAAMVFRKGFVVSSFRYYLH